MAYNFVKTAEEFIGGRDKKTYNFTEKLENAIMEIWGLDFYRILHYTIQVYRKNGS